MVFVRDTEKAGEPLEDFEVHPQASTDILQRAALYQAAKSNLFISNGPVSLALFSERPWMQFIKVNDEGTYLPNTSAFWKDEHGIEVGSQYPWAADNQQVVWMEPKLNNLLDAWSAHAALLD